jgi:hypothetical protein
VIELTPAPAPLTAGAAPLERTNVFVHPRMRSAQIVELGVDLGCFVVCAGRALVYARRRDASA